MVFCVTILLMTAPEYTPESQSPVDTSAMNALVEAGSPAVNLSDQERIKFVTDILRGNSNRAGLRLLELGSLDNIHAAKDTARVDLEEDPLV